MADYDSELRATPEQRPVIGALARLARRVDQFARKPFGYDNPPVEMISNFLGVPALYNTAENFAYGSPLTYGTGQARQLNPEVKEAALAATQFAGPLTRMVKMTKGLPVGMVIKPKGGNWLAGSTERALGPLKNQVPNPVNHAGMLELQQIDPEMYARLVERHAPAKAVDNWIDKQLNRYVKNEMGTPEDPIRALAERGITHAEVAPLNTYYGDVLGRRREAVGFPAKGLGQSEAAQRWEAAADEAIHNLPAGERFNASLRDHNINLLENPWLAKVPPETMTYGAYADSRQHLNFPHLIDELRNATNPESGLPRELLLKYESLPQVSVPQAVERVAKINEWRAAQKVAADQARANNVATVLHKEYPGQGFKWVELKKPEVKTLEGLSPEQRSWYDEYLAGGVSPEKALSEASKRSNKSLEDALKYEGDTMGHCVGGYCPDVSSGKSRIFSLRNEKTGEPHVTIETGPKADYEQAARILGVDDPTASDVAGLAAKGLIPSTERIIQIKGKGNKAPKEDYLPFVQDFVRSGKWSDVGDLQNTGLYKPDPRELGLYMPGAEDLVRAGYEVPDTRSQILQRAKDAGLFGDKQYVTRPEWEDVLRQQMKSEGVQGFAKGGAVEFDPARVDEIAQGLRNYEPNEGLAPHGLRHAGDAVKGKGYFGMLPHADGQTSTEISSEDIEGEYPLIVPTLNREELDHLLSGAAPTDEIYNKAETYAAKRRGAGKSTFAQPDELRYPVPEKFASGGAVEYNPTHVDELVNKLREELHG